MRTIFDNFSFVVSGITWLDASHSGDHFSDHLISLVDDNWHDIFGLFGLPVPEEHEQWTEEGLLRELLAKNLLSGYIVEIELAKDAEWCRTTHQLFHFKELKPAVVLETVARWVRAHHAIGASGV